MVTSNSGLDWQNAGLGLPNLYTYYPGSITTYGDKVCVIGRKLSSSTENNVCDNLTQSTSTKKIDKLIWSLSISDDFGQTFVESNLINIDQNLASSFEVFISDRIVFAKVWYSNFQSSHAFNKWYISTNGGIDWQSTDKITLGIKINKTIAFNGINYVTSENNGVWQSIDGGLKWTKTMGLQIKDDERSNLLVVNNTLFCYSNNPLSVNNHLAYLKNNTWNKIDVSTLPSSISQISASATTLFVTTFRDGIWRMPMADINAVEESTDGKLQCNIFPNPTNGLVSVSFSKLGNYTISIVNMVGTQLQSFQSSAKELTTLTLKSLPLGMYIIKVEGEGEIKNFKVVLNE